MTVEIQEPSPIFNIIEGGYYVGVWYLVGREQDFLAMVFRDPGDVDLKFRYRFRYYLDQKVHFDETADIKRVYNFDLTGKSDDEVIAIVDGIARALIDDGYLGSRLPWLVKKRYTRRIVNGDHRAMTDVLMAMPFMHQRPSKTGRN